MQVHSAEKLLALLLDNAEPEETVAESLQAAGHRDVRPVDVAHARAALDALVAGVPDAAAIARLPGPLLAALVKKTADAGRAEVLEAVARESKAAAKEVKRALHRLRAQGHATPAVSLKDEAAPMWRPPPAGGDEPVAWMTTPDPFGQRVAWFARSEPGRGLHVVMVAFSDLQGVLEAAEGQTSKKGWREMAERMGTAGAVMAVEVDRAYARGLVQQAMERNLAGGARLSRESQRALTALGPAPAEPPPSPGRALAPADPERASLLCAGLEATLFAEPTVGAWIPEEEALRATALKLDEVEHSPLVLDAAQKAALREKTIAEAVEAYWTPERRRAYAGRLYDVAFACSRAGKAELAERAAAVAAALEGPVESARLEFCRLLFARVFAAASANPAPVDGPRPATPGGRILAP